MTAGIAVRANEIRDALIADNIRATTDPNSVTPPCVLIAPGQAEFTSMCIGDARTLWTLHCLSPLPGTKDSFDILSNLVAKVIAAVPDVRTAQLTSYPTDNGNLPAIDLAWEEQTSWTAPAP